METTNTFNPNTLPYKLTADRADHLLQPLDELHMLMCDLVKKIPSLSFVVTDRTFMQNNPRSDGFDVFAGTEKVGRLFQSSEYRDGKYTKVYAIRSPRIHHGRGGRNNTKKTIHYKVVLREALKAFAPPEMGEVVSKIISTVVDRTTNLANRANSHLTWMFQQCSQEVAEYLASVDSLGPQPISEALNTKLSKDWRTRLHNSQVAKYVAEKAQRAYGAAIKMLPDGTFIAVDMHEKQVIAVTSNPYDLPENYQTKFAVLKMMEKDQPIANAGVKVEYDGAMYFYLTDGDMEAAAE